MRIRILIFAVALLGLIAIVYLSTNLPIFNLVNIIQ